MNVNAKLQTLKPTLIERVSKENVKEIARRCSKSVATVRRTLGGQPERYNIVESTIKEVIKHTIDVLKDVPKQAEVLENYFGNTIAA